MTGRRLLPSTHAAAHRPSGWNGSGDTGGSDPLSWLGSRMTGAVNFELGANGFVLPTGTEMDVYFPFACTITSWDMFADQSGSIQLDIRVVAAGSFPPTSGNSIVASAPPSLSSAQSGSSSTLTGWTTTITAGSVVRLHVTSCTTITRICFALNITRTS